MEERQDEYEKQEPRDKNSKEHKEWANDLESIKKELENVKTSIVENINKNKKIEEQTEEIYKKYGIKEEPEKSEESDLKKGQIEEGQLSPEEKNKIEISNLKEQLEIAGKELKKYRDEGNYELEIQAHERFNYLTGKINELEKQVSKESKQNKQSNQEKANRNVEINWGPLTPEEIDDAIQLGFDKPYDSDDFRRFLIDHGYNPDNFKYEEQETNQGNDNRNAETDWGPLTPEEIDDATQLGFDRPYDSDDFGRFLIDHGYNPDNFKYENQEKSHSSTQQKENLDKNKKNPTKIEPDKQNQENNTIRVGDSQNSKKDYKYTTNNTNDNDAKIKESTDSVKEEKEADNMQSKYIYSHSKNKIKSINISASQGKAYMRTVNGEKVEIDIAKVLKKKKALFKKFDIDGIMDKSGIDTGIEKRFIKRRLNPIIVYAISEFEKISSNSELMEKYIETVRYEDSEMPFDYTMDLTNSQLSLRNFITLNRIAMREEKIKGTQIIGAGRFAAIKNFFSRLINKKKMLAEGKEKDCETKVKSHFKEKRASFINGMYNKEEQNTKRMQTQERIEGSKKKWTPLVQQTNKPADIKKNKGR